MRDDDKRGGDAPETLQDTNTSVACTKVADSPCAATGSKGVKTAPSATHLYPLDVSLIRPCAHLVQRRPSGLDNEPERTKGTGGSEETKAPRFPTGETAKKEVDRASDLEPETPPRSDPRRLRRCYLGLGI